MKVIHYLPSIDHCSGGVISCTQLLADEQGKLVGSHIVTHKS